MTLKLTWKTKPQLAKKTIKLDEGRLKIPDFRTCCYGINNLVVAAPA